MILLLLLLLLLLVVVVVVVVVVLPRVRLSAEAAIRNHLCNMFFDAFVLFESNVSYNSAPLVLTPLVRNQGVHLPAVPFFADVCVHI